MRFAYPDPVSPAPVLRAATPREWIVTHLSAHQAAHDDEPPAGEPRWVTSGDLVADGATVLRRAHARLVADDGASPAAAAKWLAGWFAGGLADAAGFVYATGGAALLVDGAGVRFRLHPDGWPDRCDVGTPAVAVAPDHPWAGLPGVRVVAGDAELAQVAVAAVTAAADPLVEACRTLAKVGRAALWAEVADGFGLPVLHQLDVPVDPDVVRRLRQALRAPGRPWRKVPDLRVAHTPDGPAYLGRKGGCCLAYQSPEEAADDADLDARHRAYRERFPEKDGEPRYCSTCSLRDLAGCEERQVFWLEQERAERAVAAVTAP